MHTASALVCSSYTAVYVGSLYTLPRLFAWLRRKPCVKQRCRDDPQVIKERLASVCVATIIDMIATASLLGRNTVLPSKQPFRALHILSLMGLPFPHPSFLTSRYLPLEPSLSSYVTRMGWIGIKALALTACMYLGTFLTNILDKRIRSEVTTSRDPALARWRNYVLVRLAF